MVNVMKEKCWLLMGTCREKLVFRVTVIDVFWCFDE